ncbi:MAG: hypothetical protein HZB46_06695 [Solirubrobacterales bacterium]|nr:hypothetical protein [Solirubrobacterales bacterium]
MSRKILSLATAAVAAASFAPAAGAAGDAPAKLKVEGAYLYVDHLAASDQDFVRVVFQTADPLDRRYDGAIRAGVKIEGVASSIASVKRGGTCYTGATQIRGGRIATIDADGDVVRRKPKVGGKYAVQFSTRDGQKVTRTLTLRAERKGDDSGKPLGC